MRCDFALIRRRPFSAEKSTGYYKLGNPGKTVDGAAGASGSADGASAAESTSAYASKVVRKLSLRKATAPRSRSTIRLF